MVCNFGFGHSCFSLSEFIVYTMQAVHVQLPGTSLASVKVSLTNFVFIEWLPQLKTEYGHMLDGLRFISMLDTMGPYHLL